MLERRVEDGVNEMPLKAYLKRAFPLTPDHITRDALRNRDIRINGARAGADAVVNGGDALRIFIKDEYLSDSPCVLYQDAGLLFVEKPAGLPVDVDSDGIGADTALSRARSAFPTARLVHRLDAGTGGALAMALDESTYEKALDAFRSGEVTKRYACLVGGKPSKNSAKLVDRLATDRAAAVTRVSDRGERAELSYETVGEYTVNGARLTELEVALYTGRTHQIRVQLSHIGCPIAGDDKYGDRALNRLTRLKRPALWCVKLALLGVSVESVPEWRKAL